MQQVTSVASRLLTPALPNASRLNREHLKLNDELAPSNIAAAHEVPHIGCSEATIVPVAKSPSLHPAIATPNE